MNRRARFLIRIALCVLAVFIFLTKAADAAKKSGKEGTKKEAPAFRYDEGSKRHVLDTPGFRAEFLPSGFTFVQKKKTEEGKPVRFAFEGFYQGENRLFSSGSADAPSVRTEDGGKLLIFDRKDYREVYESLRRGFLQVYVVNTVPSRDKDLILKAKLSTALSLVPNGEKGYSIKDNDKTVSVFTQRVVLDKNLKKLPLKTVLKGDMLEITIPSKFLSEAEFPLMIVPYQAAEAGRQTPKSFKWRSTTQ